MLSEYQFLSEVPEEHQKYVERLRKFLRDYEELNDLWEKEENTDMDLYNAIIDT